MLRRLGGLLGLRLSTLASPFVARLFSVSRKLDTGTRSEAAEKNNTRQRLLYNNNPAYRERKLAEIKAWQAKNPEKNKLSNRTSKNTIYKQNPAWRQNHLAREIRRYHEVCKHDPRETLRRRLRSWAQRNADHMSTLPWKTHRPLYLDTREEHLCQSCHSIRHGGSRLWWQRFDSDDEYECHSCYVKDVDASMPAGYEGITTWKDLVARKAELDPHDQSNRSKP